LTCASHTDSRRRITSLLQPQSYSEFSSGQFVTAKPAPNDVDILLIMDEDFDIDQVSSAARSVFESARAKLLFRSDVFWARSSLDRELLDLWLETYQTGRNLRKRGIVELVLP
jgi:hypothetical protein